MIPISQNQTNTTSSTATIQQQTSSVLQQQLGIQSHGNIILVRGSRNENGQIILQNSHELLSLLNDTDDKPILLQNSRIKTSTSNGTKILHQQPDGTIVLQSGTTLKTTGGSLDGSGGHHVLLQSGAVKKSNSLPEGSIIVQQRLKQNNGNVVNHDGGPILLQTLKRLDKSQSILVFRNSGSSGANNTATTVSVNGGTSSSGNAGRVKNLIVNATSVEEEAVDKKEPKITAASRSIHIPLGAGEY